MNCEFIFILFRIISASKFLLIDFLFDLFNLTKKTFFFAGGEMKSN